MPRENVPHWMPFNFDNANFDVDAAQDAGAHAAQFQEMVNPFVKLQPIRMLVLNDKLLWDKLLYAVTEIYEPDYCCVAGGAVRDHLLGKPPKDIDIFVKLKDGDHQFNDLLANADSLGWKNIEPRPGKPYPDNSRIQLVLQGRAFDYQVELIFLDRGRTGREVVENFDFTICQHWYDGEINSTPEAKYAIQKKLWTPVQGRKLDPTLRAHFERVNKRHGNIYKLDEGEPWYNKFAGKAKIK